MQIHKKNALGVTGLLFVAAMTFAAHNIPLANVYADQDVRLNVTVSDERAISKIVQPTNGQVIRNRKVTFKVKHTSIKHTKYTLTDIDGNPVALPKTEFDISEPELNDAFTVDLPSNGEYIFKVESIGDKGGVSEDMVKFTLRKTGGGSSDDPVSPDDPDNNCTGPSCPDPNTPPFRYEQPDIIIDPSEEICAIELQLYDIKTNQPILDRPQMYSVFPDKSSKHPFDLSSFGLPSGKYRLVATIFKRDEQGGCTKIDPQTKAITIDYKRDDINVPNTGVLQIGSVSIAKNDLIASAAVAFITTTGFALFVLGKKKKEHKNCR